MHGSIRHLARLAATWPLAGLALVVAVAPPRIVPGPDSSSNHGMRIGIDPVTGDLLEHPVTPLPGPILGSALDRSSSGLAVLRHESGAVGLHLGGRFQSASIVRVGVDARLHTTCGDDEDRVRTFLEGEIARGSDEGAVR